jgi:chromosome partitioning protein
MNVLVFASRKGGSGKSTLAAHLAAFASSQNRACLLLDTDPQGSLTLWHRLRGTGQPDLRTASRGIGDIVKGARREGYQWCFVDTPPNTSAVVAEAIRAATLVLIPARPAVFDMMAVKETIEVARELRKPYAVVINAAPAKREEMESPIVAEARVGLSRLQIPIWGGQITNRSGFALSLARGAGATEFAAESLAAEEVGRLWTAIDKSVKAINGAHQNAYSMHRAAA